VETPALLGVTKHFRFGNWICFHSQVKGVETPTLLGVTKHIVSETGSVYILR
jgi:hypothetical protein